MKIRTILLAVMLLFPLLLAAYSSDIGKSTASNQHYTMKMADDSGDVPKGLKAAKNPTYKVGSHVVLKADHMKGMKGAKATIKGAYLTTAYVVSYMPTTGGERVTNHKWVIQEEIKGAGTNTLKAGTKVTLLASHMKGMYGATAAIDSSVKTTVYMVDYTPTTGGKNVKNHKWVIESEVSPK